MFSLLRCSRVLVAHQRPISAAQVKPAAQRRFLFLYIFCTSAREEPSVAARQTAASNENVRIKFSAFSFRFCFENKNVRIHKKNPF